VPDVSPCLEASKGGFEDSAFLFPLATHGTYGNNEKNITKLNQCLTDPVVREPYLVNAVQNDDVLS